VAGEYATSKGFPILDPTQDFRLGPDQMNAIIDALALRLSSTWPNGVNTTSGIATTGNVNANGQVITNILSCQGNAFVGGQLSINQGINTNGILLANGVAINTDKGRVDVAAEILDLKARIVALEKAN
jgi:hypothetical protein